MTLMTDKERTQEIFESINALPDLIADAENQMVSLRHSMSAAVAEREDAELNVMINAVIDGKNEAARKLQQQQAVAESVEVKAATSVVHELENSIAVQEVLVKHLIKRWQGAMALAELQAAHLNLMAKYQQKGQLQ